jgi:hypothetical protein
MPSPPRMPARLDQPCSNSREHWPVAPDGFDGLSSLGGAHFFRNSACLEMPLLLPSSVPSLK